MLPLISSNSIRASGSDSRPKLVLVWGRRWSAIAKSCCVRSLIGTLSWETPTSTRTTATPVLNTGVAASWAEAAIEKPSSTMKIDRMRHIIAGTAGHIDHGKTALVRALTGVDTDRLEEEK